MSDQTDVTSNVVDLSTSYNDMREYAISRLHGLFMTETSKVAHFTAAAEAFPELQQELRQHRYMAGLFKVIADDLLGPRGDMRYAEAWRMTTCQSCDGRSR